VFGSIPGPTGRRETTNGQEGGVMATRKQNEVIRIENSVGGYFPAYFAEIVDDNAKEENVIYDNVIDIWCEKLSHFSFATRQEAMDNVNLNYPIADKDCDYYGIPRNLLGDE